MRIAIIVLAVILIILLGGLMAITLLDREIRSAEISQVDLSRVPDGIYTGSFQSGRWNNQVEVTVRDHQLVEIRNLNSPTDRRSAEIVEEAIATILERQSVHIDAVSGASLNTKSLQIAVENALLSGVQQ